MLRFILKLFLGLTFSVCALADHNLGLPPLTVPNDNPQSTEKIELGRFLFNDSRFSADGTVSCASCHHPGKAFTDGLPVAKGIKGQAGTRNAPTIVNAAFYETLFLDGRANSLEDQALGPLLMLSNTAWKAIRRLLMSSNMTQLTANNSKMSFLFKQIK